MHDDDGRSTPQAGHHPLLGGNPVTWAFRETRDAPAGSRRLWPIIVGLVTTVSAGLAVLFTALQQGSAVRLDEH